MICTVGQSTVGIAIPYGEEQSVFSLPWGPLIDKTTQGYLFISLQFIGNERTWRKEVLAESNHAVGFTQQKVCNKAVHMSGVKEKRESDL